MVGIFCSIVNIVLHSWTIEVFWEMDDFTTSKQMASTSGVIVKSQISEINISAGKHYEGKTKGFLILMLSC